MTTDTFWISLSKRNNIFPIVHAGDILLQIKCDQNYSIWSTALDDYTPYHKLTMQLPYVLCNVPVCVRTDAFQVWAHYMILPPDLRQQLHEDVSKSNQLTFSGQKALEYVNLAMQQ